MGAPFRQRDAQRLIRAYTAEGYPPPRIEVGRDGKLVALPANDAPAQDDASEMERRMRDAFGE